MRKPAANDFLAHPNAWLSTSHPVYLNTMHHSTARSSAATARSQSVIGVSSTCEPLLPPLTSTTPLIPLTSISTYAPESTGIGAGFTGAISPFFNLRMARRIPSSVVFSRISIPLAKSRIARRPIFSCKSCHPANSLATTCCVYLSSCPNSSVSSFALRTLSSFSSFKRCRVSSSSPSGQRVERDREL
jgi:hypothetical protein